MDMVDGYPFIFQMNDKSVKDNLLEYALQYRFKSTKSNHTYIVRVEVSAGDSVTAGQDLVFIEAMKMETPVKAAQDGTIASVEVSSGESVDTGKVLLTMN